MNDPVTLALVFVGGAGGSAIRWLVGIGAGERRAGQRHRLSGAEYGCRLLLVELGLWLGGRLHSKGNATEV